MLDTLTTLARVGTISNMAAKELMRSRVRRPNGGFAEMVLWEVPSPVSGCSHSFKYSLAFVVNGENVVRFDNETGKGDHKHVNGKESAYRFTTVDALIADFFKEILKWER
jgi:hypothetical protein